MSPDQEATDVLQLLVNNLQEQGYNVLNNYVLAATEIDGKPFHHFTMRIHGHPENTAGFWLLPSFADSKVMLLQEYTM